MVFRRDWIHGLGVVDAGDWFKADYHSSREQFHQAFRSLKSDHKEWRSWPLEGHSQLSIDAAWVGDRNASQVVVFISGTHGVEGYCGSAIQSFLMNSLEPQLLGLSKGVAILFVHGLNPWGMQWARRCDQDGVDLNRNFIDFDDVPSAEIDYPRVLDAITLNSTTERERALNQLSKELGQLKFDMLFSGGQYEYSWAPFYGGQQPSFASRVIDEVIAHWGLSDRCLTVIDLHTGLGPWGYGELISDHPLGSQGNLFAEKRFGAAVAQTALGESFSVPKQGLLDYRWHHLMQEQGCFLTLEFGTYGTKSLFDVLLGEHLFWRDHSIESDDQKYLEWRKAMLNHFCPDDKYWRQSVLLRSWQVLATALDGVSND